MSCFLFEKKELFLKDPFANMMQLLEYQVLTGKQLLPSPSNGTLSHPFGTLGGSRYISTGMNTTIWVMFSCFPHFFCVQPGVFTYFCNLGDPITMAGKHAQLDSVRTNKTYQEMVSIIFHCQGVFRTEEKSYKVITRWAPTSSKWIYIYIYIVYPLYVAL